MLVKEATELTGGTGKASKMPGGTFGISALKCANGSKLARVPGSVCYDCYALKGRYVMANVQDAHARRLEAFKTADRGQWILAMTRLVARYDHFRWFDSGDLQSLAMLETIAEVARQTPGTAHWLPTKEYSIVREYLRSNTLPDNLVVRASAPMVDGPAPELGVPTSTVHSHAPAQGHKCPAPKQGNACGDCRACWNPDIANVSYHLH